MQYNVDQGGPPSASRREAHRRADSLKWLKVLGGQVNIMACPAVKVKLVQLLNSVRPIADAGQADCWSQQY